MDPSTIYCMVTRELPARQRGQCCEVIAPVETAWAEETAGVLRALADPTRLSMVLSLAQAPVPVCICDFTAAFDLGQPTISHHMARLKAAGIVESQKRGIWTYYRLSDKLDPRARRLVETLVASAEAAQRTV